MDERSGKLVWGSDVMCCGLVGGFRRNGRFVVSVWTYDNSFFQRVDCRGFSKAWECFGYWLRVLMRERRRGNVELTYVDAQRGVLVIFHAEVFPVAFLAEEEKEKEVDDHCCSAA